MNELARPILFGIGLLLTGVLLVWILSFTMDSVPFLR